MKKSRITNRYLFIKFIFTVSALLLFFTFFCLILQAENVLPIENESNYSLEGILEYVEDPGGSYTIDTIIKNSESLDFTVLETDPLFLGFSDSIYWLRFTLKNSEMAEKNCILEIYNPLVDSIQFYAREDANTFRISKSGTREFFKEREIFHRNILFPFILPGNSTMTFYLRIQSSDVIILPVKIWLMEEYLYKDRNENIFYGAFFGMLLLTIVFSVTVIAVLRDRGYLFYMLMIASIGFLVASETGYGYEFIWHGSMDFYQWSTSFFAVLTVILLNLFSRSFLNLRGKLPTADRIVLIYTGVCVLSLMSVPFVPAQLHSLVASIHGTVSPVMILPMALLSLLQGYKPARFFIASFIIGIISAVIYSLSIINVIPFSAAMIYIFFAGIVLTTFILNLALVDRYVNLAMNIEKERGMLQERNSQMELEINLARELQMNLIPDAGPFDTIAACYLPMEKVGGDFYDFIRFRDNEKTGIFICDVTGHGVPAAFITSMLKTALMQAGNRRHEPAHMLEYLNDMLIKQTIESFVTCIYCVFNRHTRVLQYANAGHPYPLVIHDGTIEDIVGNQSMPLAIYDNTSLRELDESFITNEITLKQNSKLLLYTDGLSEACPLGEHANLFKNNRMDSLILENDDKKGKEFIDAIVSGLVEFTGTRDFEDDICIISIDVI